MQGTEVVWVIFSVFTISHRQEAKAKTQPESGLFRRGLAGGSEGLVAEDVVVSPQWQPHSTSFILLCCVREKLEKPFGIASHRDMHLSPKSRTVMQWSPPCSELAGLYCLSVCRWVRKSSASVPAPLCNVDSAACRNGAHFGAQRCGQVSEMGPPLSDVSSFSHRILA